MATLTPDEGLEWFVEKSLNESDVVDEIVYDVGVGSGAASLSSTDTQLDVQEHRSNNSDSIVSIVNTSPQDGEIEVKITISGGTEVPAGTTITELGVWARDPSLADSNFEGGSQSTNDADDRMVYRELRPGITLASGDRKTFAFTLNVVNN